MSTINLTEGDMLRTILKTSLPMMVAFLLQSAFNIVDAFFVGKISAEALAAVSVSFPFIFMIISLGSGIGIGATSVVARFIGAKKNIDANLSAEHSIVFAFLIGVTLTIIGILSAPFFLGLMDVSESLKELSLSYLNIILLFSTFMLIAMVTGSILRGEGDMMTPMKVMGVSAVLNMILDPIFIFKLNLGIQGAAFATVVSRFLGMSFILYYILSGKSGIKLNLKSFAFHKEYIKKILTVGIPASLSNIAMSIGIFLFTTIVAFFGTSAIAAYGIGFRLDSIAILPGMGIAFAVISIVGQNIGAGKIKRAKKITIKAGIVSSGFMTIIGVLFYLFAPELISVFNNEPMVVEYGVSFLRIIPLTYLFIGISMAFSSAFLGAGKGTYALLVTLFRVIIFSIPISYILSQTEGLVGVWWGMVLGTFLGFLLSLFMFRSSGWEKVKEE